MRWSGLSKRTCRALLSSNGGVLIPVTSVPRLGRWTDPRGFSSAHHAVISTDGWCLYEDHRVHCREPGVNGVGVLESARFVQSGLRSKALEVQRSVDARAE